MKNYIKQWEKNEEQEENLTWRGKKMEELSRASLQIWGINKLIGGNLWVLLFFFPSHRYIPWTNNCPWANSCPGQKSNATRAILQITYELPHIPNPSHLQYGVNNYKQRQVWECPFHPPSPQHSGVMWVQQEGNRVWGKRRKKCLKGQASDASSSTY